MKEEDKWPAMHAYRKGVAMGELPAIRCPDCRNDMVPTVARDGDPALRCLTCRAVYEVGTHVYNQMEANIREAAQNVRNKNE